MKFRMAQMPGGGGEEKVEKKSCIVKQKVVILVHPSFFAQVSLENKELWEKFCSIGTEMIITKTGR